MRRTLITTRARALRKSMSSAEVLLWTRLRGRDPDKPTFRRQHPVGSIILDFYCPSARLALEVDGSTHWDDEAQAKDARRDAWLATQDIEVLRIPAGHVYRNVDSIADAILLHAEERRTALRTAHSPPPRSGGRGTARRGRRQPTVERVVEGASLTR